MTPEGAFVEPRPVRQAHATARARILVACVTALLLAPAGAARASYAFYVGKDLTADGSVLVGGTGEEVSGHWMVIVPRADHPADAVIEVGVTPEANIPGALLAIPQVRRTARFLSMYYSDYLGFPPPLTNGGLNEHQVAVRDVWAPSRDELVAMTPRPQKGVNYSDIARIVLQRARSAREAVEIAGALIEEHGYATYGGNSHLFADPDEGWVMWQLAGGQGLWAAERLGPDAIRVSYPGYIGDVPASYRASPDFMGSPNLISFAVAQGWYDPDSGEPFNVHEVYGAQGRAMRHQGIKFVDAGTLEQDLAAKAPVTVADLMAAVRDYRIADDEAGYGQVAHLRRGIHPDLGLLWVAPTGSITAPFVPYWIGTQEVLPEYGQHRYLMRDAGSTFLHPDFAAQEATRFAARTFKRLLYYTCEHPEQFLPEVTGALTAFEARMLADLPRVEKAARALFDAGEPELAREHLTNHTRRRASEALEIGEALLASIEVRTKLLYGIRAPRGTEINTPTHDTVNCRRSGATAAMQRPAIPVEAPPLPPDPVYSPTRDAAAPAPADPIEPARDPAEPASRSPAGDAVPRALWLAMVTAALVLVLLLAAWWTRRSRE